MKQNKKRKQQAGGGPKGGPAPLPARVESAGIHKLEVSVSNQPATDQELQKTHGPMKPWTPFEKWSLWVAIAGIIAAAVSIFIYTYQLSEMRKATEAATAATRTTQEALKFSQESAHIDQRAWLGIKSIAISPLNVGEKISISITLQNTGKTPARELRHPGVVGITPDVPKSAAELLAAFHGKIEDQAGSTRTVFPNGECIVQAETDDAMTAAWIDDIRSGKQRIYIAGTIHYTDIFGVPHTTKYFEEYVPSANAFGVRGPDNDAN